MHVQYITNRMVLLLRNIILLYCEDKRIHPYRIQNEEKQNLRTITCHIVYWEKADMHLSRLQSAVWIT